MAKVFVNSQDCIKTWQYTLGQLFEKCLNHEVHPVGCLACR